MADKYIHNEDAIAVAESYQVERTGFHLNDYEYGRNQVADSIASDLEDIEPADVVPVSAYKQVMWERDVAVEQLKQIGKGLGEAMDDVALVVHGWRQK